MLNRIINRFPYLFWMTGLILPAWYLLLANNVKSMVHLLRSNRWMQVFCAFLIWQLLGIAWSTQADYFSWERAFAATHNIGSWFFLITGFALMSQEEFRQFFERVLPELFFAVSSLVILTFCISYFGGFEIQYPGLLAFIHENKFTWVRVNRMEDDIIFQFPRSLFLGIYPNCTAMLLLLLHSLMVVFRGDKLTFWVKQLSFIFLIVAVAMTGSRLFLLFALALYGLSFIPSRKMLRLILLASPLVLIALFFVGSYLAGLREGSNSTRSILILNSINFYWQESPLMGLGIKPKIPEVLDGLPYPIGSHSTWIGAFIRNGIVGGLLYSFMSLFILFKSIRHVVLSAFGNIEFSSRAFYLCLTLILVVVAGLLEDFDSYELIPFYLGMLLYELHTILNRQ